MELTAREIHEKQFHDAWRGYNQAEVDDFLDRVAEALDRLHRENTDLKQRMTELDQAVAASRDTEEMLKKTLVTAQRAAEEAIANAKTKAEEIITQAEERVRRTETEARERIVHAENESRRKAAEAERDLTARKRELDERIDKLRLFETDIKKRLKTFLDQQLRALDALTEVDTPKFTPPAARPSAPTAGTRAGPRPQATPAPRGAQPPGEVAKAAEPTAGATDEGGEEPSGGSDEGEPAAVFEPEPDTEEQGEESPHRGRGVRDLFFRSQG
jgi:cell division initiation protein